MSIYKTKSRHTGKCIQWTTSCVTTRGQIGLLNYRCLPTSEFPVIPATALNVGFGPNMDFERLQTVEVPIPIHDVLDPHTVLGRNVGEDLWLTGTHVTVKNVGLDLSRTGLANLYRVSRTLMPEDPDHVVDLHGLNLVVASHRNRDHSNHEKDD